MKPRAAGREKLGTNINEPYFMIAAPANDRITSFKRKMASCGSGGGKVET